MVSITHKFKLYEAMYQFGLLTSLSGILTSLVESLVSLIEPGLHSTVQKYFKIYSRIEIKLNLTPFYFLKL
jgi:hypothetical protein